MPVPDFSPGEVLTAAAMDSIGLWKVSNTAFTSQATVDIENCFTTDFDNYRIQLVVTSSVTVNAALRMQLFDGGTTLSTGYGNFANFVSGGSSGVFFQDNFSGTHYLVGQIGGDRMPTVSSIDIYGPQLAQSTPLVFQSFSSYNTGVQQRVVMNGSSSTTSTTAFPSLRISNEAGTNMTGSIRIFGYRD
jgi:hypothetical protein